MKKLRVLTVLTFVAALLTGCKNNTNPVDPQPVDPVVELKSISFGTSSMSLTVGQTKTFTITKTPSNAPLTLGFTNNTNGAVSINETNKSLKGESVGSGTIVAYDTAHPQIKATLTVTVTDGSDPVGDYYASISDSLSGTELRNALNTLNNSKRKRTVGYAGMKTFAAKCDADPNGSGKIVGFYDNALLGPAWDSAKTWNREHVWPDSRGGGTVDNDAHMVRPASTKTNGNRGNTGYGMNCYDPGQFVAYYRGVASRIIFYCAIANKSLIIEESDNTSSKNSMGILSEMLAWNLEYLPTDTSYTGANDIARRTELNRNEIIEKDANGQGNRNPFIDHPEYACKIWGATNSATKRVCGMN